ncbi:hypothetical protein AB0H51_27925 [Streptomyces griseoluteus]|uniref:hypothetical protein n=1 Tax=Streptomyces griseoluteus TaxID=29306 RepID=UPI0033E4C0E2
MAITLTKPNFIVIISGDGEVLACEPMPATPEERAELKSEAHIACLTLHEVEAADPEAAMAQARRDIAAGIADDIANECPDTPAEAARRRVVSAWVDLV